MEEDGQQWSAHAVSDECYWHVVIQVVSVFNELLQVDKPMTQLTWPFSEVVRSSTHGHVANVARANQSIADFFKIRALFL